MFGGKARRNNSLIQRSGDHDDDAASVTSSSSRNNCPPKRSASSFHQGTDLQRQRDSPNPNYEDDGGDEETIDDLHETITNLKQSVMNHANSSADTMEHFSTLQKAHDTLYKEHVHLQEQMDDAVELLKYLKEEKGNYDVKIEELTSEMEALKGANEDSVVSMTIENLTKEKMELGVQLSEATSRSETANKHISFIEGENNELLTRMDSLQNIKEAYELQTKQHLESKTKLTNLEKERSELLDKVRTIESAESSTNDEVCKMKEEHDGKLSRLMQDMGEDKASIVKLQGENDTLLQDQSSIQAQLDAMKKDLLNYQTQESELNQVNDKLSTSLEKIAQLQREKRESATNESSSLQEMNVRFQKLEEVNNALNQEKADMQLYVGKMEETLGEKDEALNKIASGFQDDKKLLQHKLVKMQEELEAEYTTEKEGLTQQISTLTAQLSTTQETSTHLQQDLSQQLSDTKSTMENTQNELICENESLKYKIQELEGQIEDLGNNEVARGEIHAQLEKEMQERLAKRIAVQLHEQKITIQAEIRTELDEEYASKHSGTTKELENKLREQLTKVTEERERWKEEQLEIQKKVLDSQQQFEKVREGFKKKYEKEKARGKELVESNQGQQIVIEKLSDEYQEVKEKLEEVQEQMRSNQESSNEHYEEDKTSLMQQHQKQIEEVAQREEKHLVQIEDLQNEINELLNEQTTYESEHKQWDEEREDLAQQYNEKKEELSRAMEDLEQLNSENAEYLQKVELYEKAAGEVQQQADEYEDSRVKFSVLQIEQKELKAELEQKREQNEGLIKQMEQLNTENGELQQQVQTLEQKVNELTTNLTSTQDESSRLTASLQETSQVCQDLGAKVASHEGETGEAAQKVQSLEEKLAEVEAALATASAVAADKEKVVADLAETESKNQEVIAGLQRQAADSASQVSKLIDQLSTVTTEKVALATKFQSESSDISKIKEKDEAQRSKIAKLESANITLSAERDTANSQISELLSGSESVELVVSSLQLERNDLASAVDVCKKTIARLEAERAEVMSKAGNLDGNISELELQVESLTIDLDVSKSEVNKVKSQLESSNQQLSEAEIRANSNSENNSISEEYEANIRSLYSVINELKGTNSKLTTDNTALRSQNLPPPQSADPTVNDLMKDLVEVNNNSQQLKQDHQNEVQMLKDELGDIKDTNVALEEACQDIQVEKEDMELENEELATKLTDLTTQAKMMLLNNESLEETIQDQQIEYEDRIAELEDQLDEKYEDDEVHALHQKHKAALETIVKLKKEIGQPKNYADAKVDLEVAEKLNRFEEENLELRQVVDHLSSENDAAKEIKLIVLDLRAKNMEMAEDLRVSREQNEAAANIIENHDNLRNGKATGEMLEARARDPLENESDDLTRRSDLETELKHYKSMVTQMASERNVFNQQLSQLMGIPGPPPSSPGQANDVIERALVPVEKGDPQSYLFDIPNQGAMVPATNSREVTPYSPIEGVEDQIRSLTIENGQLAQRLGGAVAEKEFAMTTLSKLGAKMEELIERNKLLSDIADMKSNHHSRGAKYYTGGESLQESKQSTQREHEGRGLDPEEISEVHDSKSMQSYYVDVVEMPDKAVLPPPRHDDPSVFSDMASSFGGSTIMSYEPSYKKLEPESSASCMERIAEDDGLERRRFDNRQRDSKSAHDPQDAMDERHNSLSDRRRVKVPGGEYFGQLNDRGQKHGDGKMNYDNGNEYEGQWNNNKREGKGTTKYSSGNVYTGTWKTGKRHGFGVFHIKKTGDIYRGNWAQGLKSGPGVYEYADGELDVSFYEEDIRVGEGVRWSASRHQASLLVDGQLVGEEGDMPIDEATKRTKELGFVV